MKEDKTKDWKVYFDKNFWAKSGEECSNEEIQINRKVVWDGITLHIPAVYVCKSGIIVDICLEVDPECVKRFMKKWNLYKEESMNYSDEETERILAEHPLNWDIDTKAKVNGELLTSRSSCGVSWIPDLQEGLENDPISVGILEHYHLDARKAWGIHRYSFAWDGQQPSHIDQMDITLQQRPVLVSGDRFEIQKAGERVSIKNPVTGKEHQLVVMEYENRNLEQKHFAGLGKDDLEYPSCFTVMSYTLEPDLEENKFLMQDCSNGDAPRSKGNGEKRSKGASAVAVIGGRRGSVSVFVGSTTKQKKTHTICSALHFEPVESVAWKMGFYKKVREDIIVELV